MRTNEIMCQLVAQVEEFKNQQGVSSLSHARVQDQVSLALQLDKFVAEADGDLLAKSYLKTTVAPSLAPVAQKTLLSGLELPRRALGATEQMAKIVEEFLPSHKPDENCRDRGMTLSGAPEALQFEIGEKLLSAIKEDFEFEPGEKIAALAYAGLMSKKAGTAFLAAVSDFEKEAPHLKATEEARRRFPEMRGALQVQANSLDGPENVFQIGLQGASIEKKDKFWIATFREAPVYTAFPLYNDETMKILSQLKSIDPRLLTHEDRELALDALRRMRKPAVYVRYQRGPEKPPERVYDDFADEIRKQIERFDLK